MFVTSSILMLCRLLVIFSLGEPSSFEAIIMNVPCLRSWSMNVLSSI
jgi:hypothetical protein